MMKPFIICKASAGSGKTFRLVVEFLKLTLDGPEDGLAQRMRSILAITFTNKAVDEMRTRILKELDNLSDPEAYAANAGMAPLLLAELREMPYFSKHPIDAEELARLSAALRRIVLHHYSDLSICTIDSFMSRIAQTFAHDLGLPINFEVVLDQQTLIDNAVEQLIQQLGTDGNEELTRFVLSYVESKMDDEKGYQVARSLAALSKELFREGVAVHLERLSELKLEDFDLIYKQLREKCRRFEKELATMGKEAMDLLRGANIEASDCYQTEKGFWGYFNGLEMGKINTPNSYTIKTFEEGKWCASKPQGDAKERLEQVAPALHEIYNRLLSKFDTELADYNTWKLLQSNLYATALLNRLDAEVKAYSAENERVHLSEFYQRISKQVSAEPAPFIFERLGCRYRHFLIDEFQDTSIMQWHNLVPLIDNGLSQGHESLVVGDAKQAIYRFRGGEVSQFVSLPQIEGLAHPVHWEKLSNTLSLVHNRRTAREVVEFNNQFFSWLAHNRFAHNPMVQDIFVGKKEREDEDCEHDELRQEPVKSERGYVGALFYPREDPEEGFQHILNVINQMHDERGYDYKDMMILARANKDLSAVSDYLATHSDIPLSSRESFLLTTSHAVMIIVATLRYLASPSDKVPITDLLYHLRCLQLIDDSYEEALMAAFGEIDLPKILRSINPALTLRPQYLSELSLYDCCEEIVRELKLDGIETPYVASLLNRVSSFSTHYHQGVTEFLQWFDEQKALSVASSENVDAVNLLTIHKAKGLERPIVICYFANRISHTNPTWVDLNSNEKQSDLQLPSAYVSLSQKSGPTWFEHEAETETMWKEVDELNVLYVALTRPREQLFIISPEVVAKKGKRDIDLRHPALISDFFTEVVHGTDWGDSEAYKKDNLLDSNGKRVSLQQLSYDDWRTKVDVASPAEKALNTLIDSKVRFGQLAHSILSKIGNADEVNDAVSEFIEHENVTEEERQKLQELIIATINHPQCKIFFNKGNTVKTECRLLCEGTESIPDRVIITNDELYVVDFKTGQQLEKHESQIHRYCDAMRKMGYQNVHGVLLYLLPEVKRVDVE